MCLPCCVLPPPLQANVTIVDVGRTAEGCAAYLSVGTATVGQCQNTVSGLGSSTSAGAQNWLLENVPGQPGYVYISNEVMLRWPPLVTGRGEAVPPQEH